MSLFTNYDDWRNTMIKHAGLTLDHDYCTERIAALKDEGNASTAWFQQALSENK